jgi:CheY-like chemotaxis protein
MIVMIVEDEKTSRFLLHKILSTSGYDVIEAWSGTEALKKLREGEKPDVIISDIMMPVMDGLSFVQHLKDDPELTDIPVILCSALHDKETVMRAGKLGVKHYITKPLIADNIIEQVRKIIENPDPVTDGEHSGSTLHDIHPQEKSPPPVDEFVAGLSDRVTIIIGYAGSGAIEDVQSKAALLASDAKEKHHDQLAAIAAKIAKAVEDGKFSQEGSELLDRLEKIAGRIKK